MTKTEAQRRYPGLEPFSSDQKDLFFGRQADVTKLLEMVSTRQQVLLYAKSGLGKSSLINAGLIPRLGENPEARIIPVRIGTWVSEQSPSPLTSVHAALEEVTSTILDRIIPQEGSLWSHFKSHFLAHPEAEYYLIFDQFEELFTHPEENIFTFKKQLADLLYRTVPQYFRSVLEIRQRENPFVLSAEEMIQLFHPLNIKVIYAIREDRYSELNRLSDYLPDLLHFRYHLGPLTRAQAVEAIVKPAQMEGNFITPPFEFSREALQRITDYLTSDDQQNVETTQLQILCSHIENLGKPLVSLRDIPPFDNIFLRFYEESIDCLPPDDRLAARKFIEDEMILNGHRIAHHRLVCLEYISAAALDILLRERHLFRTERSSTGGVSYELSHDTLVAPILKAKRWRNNCEAEQAATEQKRHEAEIERRREEKRVAAEKKLREDYEKEQMLRERADKRLRQTRYALVFAVVCLLVAMVMGLFGYKNLELRGLEKSKTARMERMNEAIKAAYQDSVAAYEARFRAVHHEMDSLTIAKYEQRARNSVRHKFYEDACGYYSAILLIDSTRTDIKQNMATWCK